jgi:hypothetical protein
MKNISTGTGLCVLGLCLASYPIIDRVMPRAEAGATHVAAVVAAATAQNPPEPTIVWYGCVPGFANINVLWAGAVVRAWSDGRIEAKMFRVGDLYQGTSAMCVGLFSCPNWVLISDPAQGYNASADINFDSKVDGADLSQVLAMWGDAPRHDVPPSTCPLNLINP